MRKIHLLLFVLVFSVPTWSQGLVAYYPLDGNANDMSGNNNNGTIIGGVTPTTDQFGNPNKAMQFNGVDGYIEVPNSTSLQSPSSASTLAAWLYIDGFPGTEVAGMIQKTNSTFYGQYGLSYQAWGSNVGIYYYHETSGGGVQLFASITLALSTWYFVAATFDGNTATIYLDGVPIETGTLAGPIVPDNNPLTMGLESPGNNEFLQGKLDEIRIYNRALTPQEILNLTGVEDDNNSLVLNDFKLFQNYPNPFNPTTTVKYNILEREYITLKIYDIMGNEISTLVNEEKPSGSYQIHWNAVNLPSGVYFYSLKAGSFVETKKMILLK